MNGFDYHNGKAISQSVSQWRTQLLAVLSAGGFRRMEHGETFAHGADGKIAFEIYGRVSGPAATVQA